MPEIQIVKKVHDNYGSNIVVSDPSVFIERTTDEFPFTREEKNKLSLLQTGDTSGGNVTGTTSSVDGNIVLFNGIGGKTIKDSGYKITDLSGGTVNIITKTYTEIYGLTQTSGLIPGQKYLITDYQTIHEIPRLTGQFNSGTTEPLIVTALNTSKLEPIAYSTVYSQDIIYYNINNNQSIVPGCRKGYIYRRIDTKQNNDIGFDFRQVKFFRSDLQVQNNVYSSGATYNLNDVVLGGSPQHIYISMSSGESGNTLTNTSKWRIFEGENWDYVGLENWVNPYGVYSICNDTSPLEFKTGQLSALYNLWSDWENYVTAFNNVIKTNPISNIINSVNTVIFGDVFSENYIEEGFTDNNIGAYFLNNTIKANFFNNSIGDNFQNNNIGINFTNNSISQNFNNNIIGIGFYSNSIGDEIYSNKIGDGAQDNIITHSFANNTIENGFYNNIIEPTFTNNKIGDVFTDNKIGIDSNDNHIGNTFQRNVIGSRFKGNILGNFCSGNILGEGFINNKIGNFFNSNNIGLGCQYNNIGNYMISNTVGTTFQYNNIGNTFISNLRIGDGSQANNIGNNFSNNNLGSFSLNNIGNQFSENESGNDMSIFSNNIANNFTGNVISGGDMTYNTICNNFINNIITQSFTMNFIEDNINLNYGAIDFTNATHVYAPYNCELFATSSSSVKLMYDKTTIVDVNS